MVLAAITATDNQGTYSEDFARALTKICQQLGCKLPAKQLFFILYEFHCKYFCSFTLAEVKIAFELHLVGELRGEKGEKIKHYQNFDCEFYSSIMTLYKARRDKVALAASGEIHRLELPVNTARANELAHQDILQMIIDDFTATRPEAFVIKYKILKEEGLINLSQDQIDDYMAKAREKIRVEAAQKIQPKVLAALLEGKMEKDVKATARRLAYLDFIKDKSNLEKIKALNENK